MTVTRLLKWCLFFPGCPLPVLLSCSHPRVEEFEASIGQIAQDDIIHRFGYPQRLKKPPTGTEVWDYEFLAGNSRCVGTVSTLTRTGDPHAGKTTALPVRPVTSVIESAETVGKNRTASP